MAVLTAVALHYDVRHRHDACSEFCVPASPFVAVGGAVVTGVATLAGAAIGAAGAPRERWIRVTPPVRVGVVPAAGGGTAVALGFRF